MSRKNFKGSKEYVRFKLVPTVDENGQIKNLFKPVQKTNHPISLEQDWIKQFTGDDCIKIDGKQTNQEQIPSYILEQIKGNTNLIYNTKFQQQSQIQLQQLQQQQYEQEDDDDDQWIDEQQQINMIQSNKIQQKEFILKQEQFPKLENINLDGQNYQLTVEQIELLNCILPQNYKNYNLNNLQFPKYDQYGLLLQQKQQCQKYICQSLENKCIIDSFRYIPKQQIPIYDNDLKPIQIKGQLKYIQQALDYDGNQPVYDELEDDFFIKMVQAQINTKKSEEKINVMAGQKRKKPKYKVKQIKSSKYDQIDEGDYEITDNMLEQALKEFQEGKEPQNGKIVVSGEQNKNVEQREDCIGPDGQLDWRCLTKQEKKQYMRTKIIRSYYDEVRQREIHDKMEGKKKKINQQDLHLKKWIPLISYDNDHVMQKALQKDENSEDNENIEIFSSENNDDDDIISYHAKTSIISDNLTQIIQPLNKKKKIKQNNIKQQNNNIIKIKIISQKRNKNQTKQQRKQRKQKLKNMKKNKKQQKNKFIQEFQKEKKKNNNNLFQHKQFKHMSYIKII